MLVKRHQTYYFRWQVPFNLRPTLGRRELVRSLRTHDILTAKKRALAIETKIKEILTLQSAFQSKELTEDEYKTIVSRLWSRFDEPLKEFDHSNAPMNEQEHATWCQEQLNLLTEKAKWKLSYDSRDMDEPRVLFRLTLSEFLENEFNIRKINSADLEKIVDAFFHVRIHEYERMLNSLPAQEFTPTIPDFVQPKHLNLKANTPTQKTASGAWKDYENEKVEQGAWSNEKTRNSYNTQFADFIEMLGKDIAIRDVSREHATNILSSLKRFPAHRKKRFEDTPLSAIPEDAEAISANSINQRLDLISGFFKWAMKRGHITTNPFEGLRVKATDQSYATYTEKDIQELFNLPSARIKKSWQFWIPRIALYSGARQNEIANLRTTDFHLNDIDDIHYMLIKDDDERTVKTSAAIRQIPIHPDLIKNGLLSYIEKVRESGSINMWPSLTPKAGKLGQRVSEYWGNLKNTHTIPSTPTNEKGERKVFHSMRRLVINQMRDAGIPLNHIQAVIGHEQSMLGETGTYLDALPLPQCFNAIKAINHNGINWEHPKKFITL